jgi:peptidylprolyl isomerase
MIRSIVAVALALVAAMAHGAGKAPVALADLLADSPPSDWRTLDPQNTVYFDLPSGRVVVELAPAYAPAAVTAVRKLVRDDYFDESYVVRAQDNYVVQWARLEDDPRAQEMREKALKPEFARSMQGAPAFVRLPYPDTYAAEVGFAGGFPAARDPQRNQTWLVHCYGMVGVGRDNAADSGNGSELYVVIGQSPRHLDRNITLVGRVVQGIELLSALPRGTGPLGFYDDPGKRTQIVRARLAADLADHETLEALRTDSKTFQSLVASRANRREEWFKEATGRLGVCNTPLPVRTRVAQ